MIIINKTLTQQRLIVTVSENSSAAVVGNIAGNQFATWGDWPSSTWDNSAATYTLTVFSPYSNKTYTLSLPTNTSPFIDRYDEFIIDTPAWETGFYNYSISEDGQGVVEIGNLEVIDGVVPTYVSMPTLETDDDVIVYKNSQE